MSHAALFIPNKRKYLFCGDHEGMKLLSDVIEHVIQRRLSYELFLFQGKRDLPEFSNFLEKQKMGTYLYVSLPYKELAQSKQMAEDIGFSGEEAQFIGYGEKMTRIFCCRCHGITETAEHEKETACGKCGLELSLSDHYSLLHNAYLGYVAKL